MEAVYKRDLNHNYLVLPAGDGFTGEGYEIKMLENNRLPGFLECRMRRIDGKLYFYYEVTAMQAMEKVYLKKPLDYATIRRLLFAVKDGADTLKRYLLRPDGLMLDPGYLFLGPEGKIYLCYVPETSADGGENRQMEAFLRLSEYILKKLDHDDSNAVFLGYELYNQASEENFSLMQIIRFAATLKETPEKEKEKSPETAAQEQKAEADDGSASERSGEQGHIEKEESRNGQRGKRKGEEDGYSRRGHRTEEEGRNDQKGQRKGAGNGYSQRERRTEEEDRYSQREQRTEVEDRYSRNGKRGGKRETEKSGGQMSGRESQTGAVRKWALAIGISLVIAAALGCVIIFAGLTYTQTGGLLFIFAAILCGGLRALSKKRLEDAEEDDDDDDTNASFF